MTYIKRMGCYHRSRAIILWLFILICWTNKPSYSQGLPGQQSGLFFYPIIYYTPETKLALGGTINYFFRPEISSQKSRPSLLRPLVIFTFNKQFISQIDFDHYWDDEAFHLYTLASFIKYPDKFFGIGNCTRESDEESYTSQTPSFKIFLQRRIMKGLYLGIEYEFADYKITKVEENGIIDQGTVLGSQGGSVSGIGARLNVDTRDNIFYPAKGFYGLFSVASFSKKLGSDYRFVRYTLDLRTYIQLFSGDVLALQGYLKSNTHEPPFQEMSHFGGPNMMRGYYYGRYRDRHMTLIQGEYRMNIWGPFGCVLFGGLGNVEYELKDFRFDNLKPSYGFGIRYLVDPREKINLRVDFGFGEDSKGIYFGAIEVF